MIVSAQRLNWSMLATIFAARDDALRMLAMASDICRLSK
jgi:hypothetical protein